MLDKSSKREAYVRMLRIRVFESEGARLYLAGKIPGAFHPSSGQEAAIVGACMALKATDVMTGTHRSHGHPIGKGANLNGLMAELMGKEAGICKGRGGSMHLADNSVGIIGESAIVGGGIPLATGCGLSSKVLGLERVALCFFGDGAVNQGTFHESLNMASLWKLPVIYLCENNGYAITTPLSGSHAQPSIAKRAEGYGITARLVDGQNILEVYAAARDAVTRARAGEGPTLIEAQTYRFEEHQVGLIVKRPYRSPEEVELNRRTRDPLILFRKELLREEFTEGELHELESQVEREVADAVAFAESASLPEVSSLYDYMFSDPILYPPTH